MVKWRARPEAADQAPRVHNLLRARGAQPSTVHGPLQRLSGARVPDDIERFLRRWRLKVARDRIELRFRGESGSLR